MAEEQWGTMETEVIRGGISSVPYLSDSGSQGSGEENAEETANARDTWFFVVNTNYAPFVSPEGRRLAAGSHGLNGSFLLVGKAARR